MDIDKLKRACAKAPPATILSTSLVWFEGTAARSLGKDHVAIQLDDATVVEIPLSANPDVSEEKDGSWRVGVKYGTAVTMTTRHSVELSKDCGCTTGGIEDPVVATKRSRRNRCWCYSLNGRLQCLCCGVEDGRIVGPCEVIYPGISNLR